jgi:hypothetical protein
LRRCEERNHDVKEASASTQRTDGRDDETHLRSSWSSLCLSWSRPPHRQDTGWNQQWQQQGSTPRACRSNQPHCAVRHALMRRIRNEGRAYSANEGPISSASAQRAHHVLCCNDEVVEAADVLQVASQAWLVPHHSVLPALNSTGLSSQGGHSTGWAQ